MGGGRRENYQDEASYFRTFIRCATKVSGFEGEGKTVEKLCTGLSLELGLLDTSM